VDAAYSLSTLELRSLRRVLFPPVAHFLRCPRESEPLRCVRCQTTLVATSWGLGTPTYSRLSRRSTRRSDRAAIVHLGIESPSIESPRVIGRRCPHHTKREGGIMETNRAWNNGGRKMVAYLSRVLVVLKLPDRYHPERHYMRGPGPKWLAKHRNCNECRTRSSCPVIDGYDSIDPQRQSAPRQSKQHMPRGYIPLLRLG